MMLTVIAGAAIAVAAAFGAGVTTVAEVGAATAAGGRVVGFIKRARSAMSSGVHPKPGRSASGGRGAGGFRIPCPCLFVRKPVIYQFFRRPGPIPVVKHCPSSPQRPPGVLCPDDSPDSLTGGGDVRKPGPDGLKRLNARGRRGGGKGKGLGPVGG